MLAIDQTKAVELVYRNHRGEVGVRYVIPYENWLHFGKDEFHPEEQWLLRVWDLEKQADRTYSMKDVVVWGPAPPENERVATVPEFTRRVLEKGAVEAAQAENAKKEAAKGRTMRRGTSRDA